ncbi:lysM domain receptor-like kinase 4 [Prosopis cineraria]|uniref:lysM domain receptor-like kinase 4 n=1 Tax=Prosopis cineraria TaxID=364024 RepID=UPI00240EB1C5|nr:lysM domain receptor-like kinase 4 [Prosopis cineraria]
MIHLWFIASLCISSSSAQAAQQFYDSTNCSTYPDTYPGSRYTCKTPQDPCETYLVFRSNQRFHNLSEISKLFNLNPDTLLQKNSHLNSSSQFLEAGKEVLIPVTCSCSGDFYQVSFRYIVPENTTFSEIACGVYEGLLKSFTLEQDNLNKTIAGAELNVPLRCACPDNSTALGKKVKYLVTYPIIRKDSDSDISAKFGISEEDFFEANDLPQFSTLFAQTTVLVPLRDGPIKITDIPESSPAPTSGFLPTLPVAKTERFKNPTSLYIAGSVIGFLLLIMAIVVSVLCIKALRKWKSESVQPFTPSTSVVMPPMRGSSTTSCLSPDFLAGIKYCLVNYSIEELRMATKDFSEETQISGSVYKGLISNLEMMIKRMRFEDTRRLIDLHSKINHINVVNLLGVCYDERDLLWSYLVFEWPKNGCLRDCLSDACNLLCWKERTQIASDIATGLHYFHRCAFPSYAHLNVSSRNIFITKDFRGKLADIAAPDNLVNGPVSEKEDIFAFGVVLLELISARENIEGKLVKDSVGFLGGAGNEGGCFEGLRSFMDPNLKDYHLAEALCLAVLAKACVADDPLHRPTMDDIMKVLAKTVSPRQPEK